MKFPNSKVAEERIFQLHLFQNNISGQYDQFFHLKILFRFGTLQNRQIIACFNPIQTMTTEEYGRALTNASSAEITTKPSNETELKTLDKKLPFNSTNFDRTEFCSLQIKKDEYKDPYER